MCLQKLSMYGDLDYLTNLQDSSLLTKVTPIGPDVQAPPLPLKMYVQSI